MSLTDLLTGIYTVENEKSNGNLKSQNRVIAGLIPLHWLYTYTSLYTPKYMQRMMCGFSLKALKKLCIVLHEGLILI